MRGHGVFMIRQPIIFSFFVCFAEFHNEGFENRLAYFGYDRLSRIPYFKDTVTRKVYLKSYKRIRDTGRSVHSQILQLHHILRL